MQRALATILGERVVVVGAGRTDAGVHAGGQVASLVTGSSIPTAGLKRALNALLPADMHVRRVREAPPGFHARFSAIRRTYRYRMTTRRGPISRRYAWLRRELPPAAARGAARKPWLGRHSFHALTQGEGAQGDTHCTIERAEWRNDGDRLTLVLAADRFLYRMVRTIVAVVVAAHRRGTLEPDAMAALLDPGATRPAVAPAPAAGLFLVRVDYRSDPGTEVAADGSSAAWDDERGGVE